MTAFHVLSSAAVAFVIARAGVFAWLRRGREGWVEFVSCPLCVGFWVGVGLGVARLSLSRFGGDPADFWGVWQLAALDALDLVAGGALVGATAFLYACLIDFLDALEQASKRAFQAEKAASAPRTEDRLMSTDEVLSLAFQQNKPQDPAAVLVEEGEPCPEKPPGRP